MPKAAAGAVLVLVALPLLLRLPLVERRGFNPDELEHLHFAWNVARGQLPYRDYFDHHTPWLHYMLAPVAGAEGVDVSGDAALGALFRARRLMWPCAVAILAFTFALARVWHPDRRLPWLAVLLLANTGVFLSKTFDVRPDVPATALTVAGLWTMLLAWQRLYRGGRAVGIALLSGLALGAATMFTQKVLFLGPGLLVAVLLLLFDSSPARSRGARLLAVAAQAAGFLLPVGATLAWFAAQGALRAFVDANFVVNARWPGLGPAEFVRIFVQEDAPLVALAVVGFGLRAREIFRPAARASGEPLVALALLSPVAALAVHPAVTFHYFLFFVPQAALYGACALTGLVDRVRTRHPGPLLAAACVLLSVQPLLRLRATFDRGNWGTLQGIRYVLRNSAPWETTFDGFSGLGVFRPGAFFHPFHHWHILAIQTDAERAGTLEALRTGAALPKLVFWDAYLREGITPEVAAFLQAHYVPAGLEPILVRPFDNGLGWWTDEGPRYLGWVRGQERAPHVLFGEGWRDPGLEDGRPSRRTRTAASQLVVPIKHPRDSRVVLRAKADPAPGPFAIALVVNGEDGGHVVSAPRWQDYEFQVPGRHLRPGFNRFELRFSQPAAREPRPLELAVESLALYRVSSPPR